jgi:haloacetate dehalogenase
MFVKYQTRKYSINGVKINCQIGGKGPALLLLHGHPQTHVMWHKIADELTCHFTVVASDLRGYGDSDKPSSSPTSEAYSKRTMARDQKDLMGELGFNKFSILAHDRGARVAHRLAMDFSDAVQDIILLDIAPTLAMYEQTSLAFAKSYWHWFFLIRPAPLPELLIETDPEQYLRSVMGSRSAGMAPFSDAAFMEYLRCLRQPGSATGICEDYRASATIDLEHDRTDINAGNKLACPLMVLWGEHGTVGKCFDPLQEWRKVAINVTGEALPSGHYIAEEVPELLLQRVLDFHRTQPD